MAVEEEIMNKQKNKTLSMTKSDQPEDAKQSPAVTAEQEWGTWEELLLAYAVNRYGTNSWDSISSELRKRTSTAPIHITPHCCEQKYGELKRRFNQSDENDVVAAIPWLDELRKLRVLELQRELQNYDLYISSLQTKVKRLTEEREKKGEEIDGRKSDLRNGNDEIEPYKPDEATDVTPEPAVSGEDGDSDSDSDRENQSVNGSNGNGISPVGTGDEKPESAAVLREGDSLLNGEPEVDEPVKSEPEGEPSGSKSEGKNSDVQSSASKKSRNEMMPRGSSKEDEDESTDSIPVRSLPLVDFLQKVQKVGSVVFDRRLDRQEKQRYNNLIRQNIDYETLQTRLKEGRYSDGNDKFFRDLLLLVNNTRIFFPKQSPESTAAVDLRHLILSQMISKKKHKTDSKPTNKQTSSNRDHDPLESSLLKPKLSGPIMVCRKRSSITAKAARKKDQTGSKGSSNPEKLIEEKPKKTRDSFPLVTKRKGKSPINEIKKKTKLNDAEEKKQNAAMFLNRMKRSNEPLLNVLKSMPQRGIGGGDGKKDQGGKKTNGERQVKEQGSPAKRTVGRPPKRVAALPVSGKRNRESVDSELGSKQKKKRSKK